MQGTILIFCLVIVITSAAPNSNVNVDVDVNVGKGAGKNHMDGPADGKIKCGMETTSKESSKRIINGDIVNIPRKYSWQVGLYQPITFFDNNLFVVYDQYCGGSIINDKYVLTAAHCLYVIDIRNKLCKYRTHRLFVGMGSNKRSDTVIFIEVVERIFNNFNCLTNDNDIALLELKKSISGLLSSGVVSPICIPSNVTETFAGKNATVSGWGSTIGYNPAPSTTPNPPADSPDELREATVPIISNADCKERIQDLTDNMLCASTGNGFAAGGKDSCQGDSGGPLTYKEDTQHAQIGVVSFGFGCASKGNPGIYARVTRYLEWIKIEAGKIYELP